MPVFRLSNKIEFPPPELAEPDGLLALGGDLSVKRILKAYEMGIFPWYSEGDPILWWSPAPRLVLFPKEFHVPKRLIRVIKKNIFYCTADNSFSEVIHQCAAIRGKNREQTWITTAMNHAYCRLHELGYAHSIECWQGNFLAGGLYGIQLGKVFFGESMFTRVTDSSKIALTALVHHTKKCGIKMIDCQMKTDHLVKFGAREIERDLFQENLKKYTSPAAPQKKWRLHKTNKEGIGYADACQEKEKG